MNFRQPSHEHKNNNRRQFPPTRHCKSPIHGSQRVKERVQKTSKITWQSLGLRPPPPPPRCLLHFPPLVFSTLLQRFRRKTRHRDPRGRRLFRTAQATCVSSLTPACCLIFWFTWKARGKGNQGTAKTSLNSHAQSLIPDFVTPLYYSSQFDNSTVTVKHLLAAIREETINVFTATTERKSSLSPCLFITNWSS